MPLHPDLCDAVVRKGLRLYNGDLLERQKGAKDVDTNVYLSSVERLKHIPQSVLRVSV